MTVRYDSSLPRCGVLLNTSLWALGKYQTCRNAHACGFHRLSDSSHVRSDGELYSAVRRLGRLGWRPCCGIMRPPHTHILGVKMAGLWLSSVVHRCRPLGRKSQLAVQSLRFGCWLAISLNSRACNLRMLLGHDICCGRDSPVNAFYKCQQV